MTTWPPTQAEAWMRANPGRWLEDCDGDMWRWFRGQWWIAWRDSSGTEAVREPTSYDPLTWHPPREHWAEEVRKVVDFLDEEGSRIAAIVGGQPVTTRVMNAAANTLRALFRAAPEVDGE